MKTKTKPNAIELTREQILDLADAQGRKLGFLLATSGLDTEIKEAILSIIDEATPEQINSLVGAFEAGYLEAKDADLDYWMKMQMNRIKWESEEQQRIVQDEALDTLREIEARFEDEEV